MGGKGRVDGVVLLRARKKTLYSVAKSIESSKIIVEKFCILKC